jgi:hypothetical protein
MGLGRLAVIGLAAAVVLGGVMTGVALSDRDEPAPVGALELRKNEDAGMIPVADDDERGDGDDTPDDDGTAGGNNGGDNSRDRDRTRGNDGTNGGDNTGPRFQRVAPAPIPSTPAPAPAPPARDWSADSWSGGGDT